MIKSHEKAAQTDPEFKEAEGTDTLGIIVIGDKKINLFNYNK